MSKIPLEVRANLRDNEPHLKKHLATIKAATGVDFTFEFKPEVPEFLTRVPGWTRNNLGGAAYNEMMAGVAEAIVNNCKDDLIKEEFLAATTNKKIILEVTDDQKPQEWPYHDYAFADGCMYVRITPQNGICNTEQFQGGKFINCL